MAFTIKQSDSYVWPVSVERAATDKPGRFEKQTFDVEFKRVTQSRVEQIIKDSTEDAIKDRQIIEELVIGWKGIVDDEGTEIPFSQQGLSMLIDIPGVQREIIAAWLESLAGAKRKN